ncbi:hypothetical protein Poly30_04470 [Planctomycetes bacterium Poly30]|uniref:Glycosyltransferase RgtA/B/C/D-like domain-containing protein n=1 Tax=Saltatorellus ferox TaxID=2528018 RepID=A0A518ELK6_9BACT|nr:hypothetical protein Poly30_04470 [Planctomycetes bacterium Poly30]
MDIAQDGNLFPREDILEAVAQSDWRDQPVPAAAWWITSIGLAVLAFGTPVLAPLAMEPTTFAAARDRLAVHPLHALAGWIGGLGIGIESAWYLLSALGFGLSLPVLGVALRWLGIGPRLALVTALVSLFTPIAVLHGRLPSDFTAGVLGSSVVLAMAFAPSDPGRAGNRGYGIRLALAFLIAVLLHPFNLALIVPLLFAARARGGITAMLPVIGAGFLAAITAPDLMAASAGQVLRRTDALLGFGGLIVPTVLAWRGSREEEPPPTWLGVWWGVALAVSIFSSVSGKGPASPMLLPAYAALVAGALARFARPDNAFRVAGALAVLHAALIAALPWLQTPTDSMGLAAARPALFEEGDHVRLTPAQDATTAAYLLRRRFGLPVDLVGEPMTPPSRRTIGLAPNALGLPWTLDPETGTLTAYE